MENTRAVELAPGTTRRRADIRRQARTIAAVAAYAALTAVLVWSRCAKLGQGLWHDEIVTVEQFVRGGPREIFFGDYLPNNHMLFSLLAWAAQLVSSAEAAVRLPSVVPFLAGGAIATTWLDRRVSRLPAILYLGLVTASPLLLDISSQARGYGLAFLAMSVLVVAGDEYVRDAARWKLVVFCAAGVAGTWTLPVFAIAFAATGLVLAVRARSVGRYLAASAVAIAIWYAPVASGLVANSDQEFGSRLAWHGFATGPIEHLLAPALVGRSVPGTGGFIAGICLAATCLASPLLRDRMRSALLLAGPLATFVVLWAARINVAPRFVSYLLVPLFALLVTGAVNLVQRTRDRGPLVAVPVSTLALAATALMGYVFWSNASIQSRFPREAHRDAASFVLSEAPGARVLAYTRHPEDLVFYLGRPVVPLERAADVPRAVCDPHRDEVVLVVQLYKRAAVSVPCLEGARHERFRQYERGGAIDVWLVPARRAPS